MTDKQYFVIISNENNVIEGNIIGYKFDGEEIFIGFNPLLALCDLLDTVYYEDRSPYIQDNYFFNEDYRKHPFFANEDFQLEIDSNFPAPRNFVLFYNAVHELKDTIINNRKPSFSQLEVYKQFYQLKFSSKIEFVKENPVYKESDTYKQLEKSGNLNLLKSFTNDPNEKYQYEVLSYNEKYDVKTMFANNDEPFRLTYTCYSLEDIIFSVWHFLIMINYKFNKCNHCGNYFSTKTNKFKYCNRKSPYSEEYSHLECEKAVRNIKQKFARRKKTIYTNLSNYYNQDILNQFLNEYYEYKEAVDMISSVENLLKLELFLEKGNVQQRWYKKEYKI